jgi:hypothetical protein
MAKIELLNNIDLFCLFQRIPTGDWHGLVVHQNE